MRFLFRYIELSCQSFGAFNLWQRTAGYGHLANDHIQQISEDLLAA
jgi:hypothetical protein